MKTWKESVLVKAKWKIAGSYWHLPVFIWKILHELNLWTKLSTCPLLQLWTKTTGCKDFRNTILSKWHWSEGTIIYVAPFAEGHSVCLVCLSLFLFLCSQSVSCLGTNCWILFRNCCFIQTQITLSSANVTPPTESNGPLCLAVFELDTAIWSSNAEI